MPSILPQRRYRSGRNIFRPRNRSKASRKAGRLRSMTPMTRALTANSIYKFTRYAAPLGMITNGGSSVQSIPFVQTFQLLDVVNYTDFTSLFDSYKIDRIDYYIQLLTNPEGFTDSAPSLTNNYKENWYPVCWYVLDDDDSTMPVLSQLREKQGVRRKVMKPNQIIKFSINPKFQKQTYAGPGGLVGYGRAKGWLDCADSGVPHYGIKGCIDFHQNSVAQMYNIEVTAKYHLSFKGVQ